MGCASSKPKSDQPASVPSSVTPSTKQAGNEKTVRFADLPTEISDKRNFTDESATPNVPAHSLSVLKDVVEEGNANNNINSSINNNTQPSEVHVAPKVEEVPVHKPVEPEVPQHKPEPVVEKKAEPVVVHSEPEPIPVVHKTETHSHVEAPAVVEDNTKHEDVHIELVTPEPTTVASVEPSVEPTPCPVEPVVVAAAAAPVVVSPSPTTPEEIKIPDKKKGYMLKQGHVVKNWKNRFFILEEGLLTYYESSTANAPYGVNKKGEMNLKDITVTDAKSLVTLSARGKGQADLVLEIKYPNEREEWIAAFRQHIAYLKAIASAGN